MFDVIREIGAMTRKIQILSNAEFREIGLDNNAFLYIIRICEQPGMFLGALADSIQIDRTTAFRTIKKLAASGWLEIIQDKDDKRLRRVYPTQKATDIYPRLHAFEKQCSAELLKNLNEDERDELRILIKKLSF